MDGVSLWPDRVVVAGALLLTGLLFVKDATDPVNIVKLCALLLCALALLVLAAAQVARERVLRLPVGAPVWSVLALAVALLVATAVAPDTSTAVFGTYGRNSGLLAYGSALLLFLVVLRSCDLRGTRAVAFGMLLASLVTASYGLFQYAGVDAIAWNNPFNPIIAALGNPDFAAAYIAIGVPLAVWAACWTGWSPVWRVLAALSAAVMLVATVLSAAFQGPIAAVAGLAVLVAAWSLGQQPRVRRLSLGTLGAGTGLALVLVLVGALGYGPGHAVFSKFSFQARIWYWQAALHMFGHSPVWGVGLDSYGDRWRQERPIAIVRRLGGDHFSDAAHSVPLQMLAQGGLVLGLAYLVFVVVTAVCLVRGLLRADGQDRLLLGGLGGAWLAYQVQSAVSIDQIPLLVAHFVLAGAVVAASGGVRLREVRLPGALPVAAPVVAGRRRGPVVLRERQLTGLDRGCVVLAAVGALVLAWLSLQPLRAARASFAGDSALGQGNGTLALRDFDRAAALDHHTALYLTKKGDLLNRVDKPVPSLQAYAAAVRRDPFDIGALRTAGRLADALKDYVAAESYFRRAARLDPNNSDTLLDLTQFELRHAQAPDARRRLEALARLLPHDAALQATLGDARLVTGDREGARSAYETARRLSPDPASSPNKTATSGLTKLRPGAS